MSLRWRGVLGDSGICSKRGFDRWRCSLWSDLGISVAETEMLLGKNTVHQWKKMRFAVSASIIYPCHRGFGFNDWKNGFQISFLSLIFFAKRWVASDFSGDSLFNRLENFVFTSKQDMLEKIGTKKCLLPIFRSSIRGEKTFFWVQRKRLDRFIRHFVS